MAVMREDLEQDALLSVQGEWILVYMQLVHIIYAFHQTVA